MSPPHDSQVALSPDTEGDSITVTITCPACAGGSYTVPLPHLATLTVSLLSVCLHHQIALTTPDNLLRLIELETQYAEARQQQGEKEKTRTATIGLDKCMVLAVLQQLMSAAI